MQIDALACEVQGQFLLAWLVSVIVLLHLQGETKQLSEFYLQDFLGLPVFASLSCLAC